MAIKANKTACQISDLTIAWMHANMFDLHIYCALRRNSVNKGFGLWIPMARQEFNRRKRRFNLCAVPQDLNPNRGSTTSRIDQCNAVNSLRLPHSRHILCRARESFWARQEFNRRKRRFNLSLFIFAVIQHIKMFSAHRFIHAITNRNLRPGAYNIARIVKTQMMCCQSHTA